jgi:hypothetical protein
VGGEAKRILCLPISWKRGYGKRMECTCPLKTSRFVEEL